MFDASPKFMKPKGKVISLVGGRTHGVVPYVRNILWPRFLGGTPRTFKILGLAPAGDLQRQVVKWVDDGFINEIPIDSEYDFDDVLKVCILPHHSSSTTTYLH